MYFFQDLPWNSKDRKFSHLFHIGTETGCSIWLTINGLQQSNQGPIHQLLNPSLFAITHNYPSRENFDTFENFWYFFERPLKSNGHWKICKHFWKTFQCFKKIEKSPNYRKNTKIAHKYYQKRCFPTKVIMNRWPWVTVFRQCSESFCKDFRKMI